MNTHSYLRAIVFGITDSLVSTVGLLAGIAVAGSPHKTLVLTGIIYAFVEAFSMAVGNFLSEESAAEYVSQMEVRDRGPVLSAFLMFVTFVVASFIPLAPYFFLSDPYALPASVFVSIAALFIAGAASARFSKLPILVRGVRMALLGGSAILIGVCVGFLVPGI